MIKRKPSEATWICCSHDPAILPAGEKAIKDYLLDRDLEKLGVDTDKGALVGGSEPVTLYKIRPLSNDQFHLIEMGLSAFREIFRTHVVAVKNADGVKVSTRDGKSYISDQDIDNVDGETLTEVVNVIVERGQGRDGEDRAFFSGDSSRLQRLRSRQLPANIARINVAEITEPDSNSDDQIQSEESAQK